MYAYGLAGVIPGNNLDEYHGTELVLAVAGFHNVYRFIGNDIDFDHQHTAGMHHEVAAWIEVQFLVTGQAWLVIVSNRVCTGVHINGLDNSTVFALDQLYVTEGQANLFVGTGRDAGGQGEDAGIIPVIEQVDCFPFRFMKDGDMPGIQL